MITTTLNSPELELYAKLNKNFGKIFEIAKKAMTDIPAVGRYEVDGDDCFYMIQEYDTKEPSRARYETHDNYIDIQIILRGEEEIRFETPDKLSTETEYNPDKDIAFQHMTDEYDSVRLVSGELSIIFTKEPHAPSLSTANGQSHVIKLIAKVRP
jgi:YhcH/YjgK/YiaL family protein